MAAFVMARSHIRVSLSRFALRLRRPAVPLSSENTRANKLMSLTLKPAAWITIGMKRLQGLFSLR